MMGITNTAIGELNRISFPTVAELHFETGIICAISIGIQRKSDKTKSPFTGLLGEVK
jgi:hypothetical protein